MKHPLTTHDRFCGQVLDKLQSQKVLMTRKQIAQVIGVSKPTVKTILDRLVSEGAVIETKLMQGKMPYYAYEIAPIFQAVNDMKDTTAHPLGIWRTACYTWRVCPSCGAKRKLRRLPSGDWLHWCGEHHSEILSKEIVG